MTAAGVISGSEFNDQPRASRAASTSSRRTRRSMSVVALGAPQMARANPPMSAYGIDASSRAADGDGGKGKNNLLLAGLLGDSS